MKLSLKFAILLFLGIFLVASVSALTADVAYVVKSTSSPNSRIVDSLNDLGYSYVLIDDSAVSTTNFSKYGLILLGNENIDNVPVSSYKSLVLDFDYYSGWSSRRGQSTSNKAFNSNDPITENIQGSFTPYTTNGILLYYLSYQKFSKAITTRGTSSSDMGNFVVAQKDNPRRIMFGLTETSYWTGTSEQLFENSLQWVLKGGDGDDDGYLLGDDCNDNDPAVHPGASDLSKNCKNDGPVMDSIETIIIPRGEIVSLVLEASDPEGDSLTYTINDVRFVKTFDNEFEWDTEGYGLGDYSFGASVTDGEYNYLRSFTVKIVNQVPTCANIPVLAWGEDSNFTLNLNDYCSDLDNDALAYGVEDTSVDQNIFLYSFSSGIAKFASKDDWYGTDWIRFFIKDSYSTKVLTNQVILEVLPINDPSEFDGNFGVLTMNEDTEMTIDLNDYFSDIDSNLIYSVQGNSKIEVIITGSVAKFKPEKDWFGVEQMIFKSSDGEFEISSNQVSVSVNNVNDAPEFKSQNCETNLLEDFTYNCLIEADDIEGNSLTYSVVSEDKLDCIFNGNNLTYVSYTDYFGSASCQIRVSDGAASDTLDFLVQIENVNDGPFIQSYTPANNNVRIVLGTNKQFSVTVKDIDNTELSYEWRLDDAFVSNSQSYNFLGSLEGNFILEVILSDGTLTDTQEWSVFVGDISQFTCSEVGGFAYAENQMCPGQNLGVKDTPRCCTLKGTYGFFDVENRCAAPSSNLNLEIDDPSDGDSFTIDEDLNVLTIAKHNYAEDHKFEIETYFYDLSEDKVIDDKDERETIGKGDEEEIEFDFEEFNSYDEVDFDSELAVLSILRDTDTGECYEDYVELSLEREENEVIISDFNLGESFACGEFIEFTGEVANIGENEENVDVTVEVPKMRLKKTLNEFTLDTDDDEKISSSEFGGLYVPADAESGEYDLVFTVHFDDGKMTESQKYKFNVSCGTIIDSGINIQAISLNEVSQAGEPNPTDDSTLSLNGKVTDEEPKDDLLGEQDVPIITAILLFVIFGFFVLKYIHMPSA